MWQCMESAQHVPPPLWIEWMLEKPSKKDTSDNSFRGKESAGNFTAQSLSPVRVLVVDDEQLIADTLVKILNLSGFLAHAVYSGDAALDSLGPFCPNIVLTDVRMPGRNGIETGVLIRRQCPETRIVLFSGHAAMGELMDQARQSGHSFELWPKPIHPLELVKRLREL